MHHTTGQSVDRPAPNHNSERPATLVDQRHLTGPFDIIGDVHGCLDELGDLLTALGYEPASESGWESPAGRTAVFVGDLVDRGPDGAGTLRLVMRMVHGGVAFVVPGNHDLQLLRHLSGEDVPLVFGLAETAAEFAHESAKFRDQVRQFYVSLASHHLFDGGRLVVAHTGLGESMHGSDTPECRQLSAYGVNNHDIDPRDVEKRHPWVTGYTGPAAVVYGHTPVLEAEWRGQTIDIDTGCVFGWRLSALRWPERELVSVPARRVYATRRRPFLPEPGTTTET